MRISVSGDDGTMDLLRGRGLPVGWSAESRRGAIILSPESEQEWLVLERIAGELNQVLPRFVVRVDNDPAMKPDGHGGSETDGTRRFRNIYLFVSEEQ